MKVILVYAVLIFSACCSQAQTIRYVAPNSIGNGKGYTASNASDFLSKKFWTGVQTLLAKEPVTVKFLGGDYERAFTERFLAIENMGSVKNKLILEADSLTTVFTLPAGHALKSQVIKVVNSTNVTIRNFRFTGNGRINYVLNITTSDPGKTTSNIVIENCRWENMKGVIYGATGATKEGTHHVIFKNCTFRNIGLNGGSHMIYNAYGSKYISIINSYFENCTGDYIRFRDRCDYGIVKGSVFHQKEKIPSIKFIAIPLFNDGIPYAGNESFATNYSFTDNKFISAIPQITAFQFSNSGYSPANFRYLPTASEGEILTNGTNEQKKDLLQQNFGIETDKVRIYNNSFDGLTGDVFLRITARYGAKSNGWTGRVNITEIMNHSPAAFKWEKGQ